MHVQFGILHWQKLKLTKLNLYKREPFGSSWVETTQGTMKLIKCVNFRHSIVAEIHSLKTLAWKCFILSSIDTYSHPLRPVLVVDSWGICLCGARFGPWSGTWIGRSHCVPLQISSLLPLLRTVTPPLPLSLDGLYRGNQVGWFWCSCFIHGAVSSKPRAHDTRGLSASWALFNGLVWFGFISV